MTSNFQIRSPNIKNGEPIEREYTKYGENKTPSVSWSGVPNMTKELLLICYDPDALPVAGKVWIHWLISGIDPSTANLEEGSYTGLKNDFSNPKYEGKGYDGPRPPPNTGVHNYHFKLYALSKRGMFNRERKYSYDDVMSMIDGHVLGETEIVGTYVK